MMKRLLLGLMLLATAGAAGAGWTDVGSTGDGTDDFIHYVDRATIRKSGNLVKMWNLKNYKTVRTLAGYSLLSMMTQEEYDCMEEKRRLLAFTWFDGQMGNGKVVVTDSDTGKWSPIRPGSIAETMFEVACGKK